jgi:apolipoprotein D and lipocalin family protein
VKYLLLFAALLLSACAGKTAHELEELDDIAGLEDIPMQSVPYVDLDRFMGRWYMIANIPFFAERGNVGTYVTYSRRPDGLIDDLYTAYDAFGLPPFTKNGLIEITNPMTGAEGRITFLKPLWQDYAVLYLDRDYRYTVIGHPSRDYAWVFAREPKVPQDVYQDMLNALTANKFDVNRVTKIPQVPEQVGQPGFQ